MEIAVSESSVQNRAEHGREIFALSVDPPITPSVFFIRVRLCARTDEKDDLGKMRGRGVQGGCYILARGLEKKCDELNLFWSELFFIFECNGTSSLPTLKGQAQSSNDRVKTTTLAPNLKESKFL